MKTILSSTLFLLVVVIASACNAQEIVDQWRYLREGGIIHGAWKLVATDKDARTAGDTGQLFNLKDDPNEMNDLAAEMPEKVHELATVVQAFKELKGPAFKSRYQGDWPPKNWRLPDEPGREWQRLLACPRWKRQIYQIHLGSRKARSPNRVEQRRKSHYSTQKDWCWRSHARREQTHRRWIGRRQSPRCQS